MTDNNHPITPPPELVRQWARYQGFESPEVLWRQIATQAARWGADMELEACCEWLRDVDRWKTVADRLRLARRPKLPSLNSIALQMLGTIERDAHYLPEITDTIRRALEQLDD